MSRMNSFRAHFFFFLSTIPIFFLISHVTSDDYNSRVCRGESICDLTVAPEPGLYKCMCDFNCTLYGDCCSDSPFYNITKVSNIKFSCPQQGQYYLIDECPPTFKDLDVKRKCENSSFDKDYVDVKIMKPVLDRNSNLTYRNSYCAQCHDIANYESFKLSYGCKRDGALEVHEYDDPEKAPLARDILANASFNSERNRFTSILNGVSYVCFHEIVIPKHLKPLLRYCEPHLISSCPAAFNNSATVEKCKSSYFDVVYSTSTVGEGEIYKNKFCAECNDVKRTFHCQNLYLDYVGASSLFDSFPTGEITCDDSRLARFC